MTTSTSKTLKFSGKLTEGRDAMNITGNGGDMTGSPAEKVDAVLAEFKDKSVSVKITIEVETIE